MTTFKIFKLIHIYAAATWFGAGIISHVLFRMSVKAKDAHAIATFARQNTILGKVFYTPAAIVLLVAGIVTVASSQSAFTFTDEFVIAGYAGVLAGGLIGALMLGPRAEAVAKHFASANTVDTEGLRLLGRFTSAAWIDTVVLLFVIWAMVFKPGL